MNTYSYIHTLMKKRILDQDLFYILEDVSMNPVESIFVISLFLLYLTLWKIKEIRLKRTTGISPKVMAKSTSYIQQYMNQFMNFLTLYAVIIIILHTIGIQYASLFSRFDALNSITANIVGFITGIFGLSFCLYAQIKMGKSWRVGIDENVTTKLVTTGLYGYIRNPTYLGLFLLNIGVWLIWPTWTVFVLNLLFVLFLEIQVRCEEDHLYKIHGEKYADYLNKTKRYLPFVY